MAIDAALSSKTPTMSKESSLNKQPQLLHKSLNEIPQTIRFGIAGTLSNVVFLAGFNALVVALESDDLPASRIYAFFYTAFIPLAHAINSLLVFGWPDPYLPSLLSNAPIGLTAMALGTFLTGYFDRMGLDKTLDDILVANGLAAPPEPDEEQHNLYSSIVVMVITGIWSYLLSVWVNSPSAAAKPKDDKKEL